MICYVLQKFSDFSKLRDHVMSQKSAKKKDFSTLSIVLFSDI